MHTPTEEFICFNMSTDISYVYNRTYYNSFSLKEFQLKQFTLRKLYFVHITVTNKVNH